jgi:hypothetical protein
MTDAIIGKGTWIDKVADNLIKREKKLGRKWSRGLWNSTYRKYG